MRLFKIGDKVRNTFNGNLGEVTLMHPTIKGIPWVVYKAANTAHYVHPDKLELRVVEEEEEAPQAEEAKPKLSKKYSIKIDISIAEE